MTTNGVYFTCPAQARVIFDDLEARIVSVNGAGAAAARSFDVRNDDVPGSGEPPD